MVAEADLVFVAAGVGSGAVLGDDALFVPVRGQASWTEGLGLDQLALPPRGISQHPVPHHYKEGVLLLLGQREELLPPLPRPL